MLATASLAMAAATTVAAAGPAAAGPPSDERGHGAFTVSRDGRPVTVPFTSPRDGEAFVRLTVAAPGVDWGTAGAESAVVQLLVDGKPSADVVVFGATPTERSFALGALAKGRHHLTLRFAADRSPAGAVVRVSRVHTETLGSGHRDFAAAANAPVMYGRNGAGGPFENAVTDTPVLAWHQEAPAATAGHRVLTYTVVWTNEDGGTSTPALMARWGRTTDIEWAYRVEVDERGVAVPGTAFFQSANHGNTPFTGRYENGHPLLQTCTLNNNMCDTVDNPMRFPLTATERLDEPALTSREEMVDRHPWVYTVMTDEVRREGKVVAEPPAATTTLIADPRDYLYAVVRKTTSPPAPGVVGWVGVTLGVRLKGDPTLYRSDNGHADWSLSRDDPAATTVRLPAGAKASDIAEIVAIRTVYGADTGSSVTVNAVNRAFLLTADDRPDRALPVAFDPATLTAADPEAVLYRV
ncbi:hypothetical protein LO772_34475 [Yinghuangia sp. ASG 101]|uniref:hypothetical protein n=1 Tax=Yinghuangia sp. ASG 101 TaxID=2896848 RepID=UPI001E362130|nr:hypothetical protein [Yinghuangia sp. ASG 101]UGQ11817.1 hypothetical protein LO772_34475 [Yinghuangia sp. ASG 101]